MRNLRFLILFLLVSGSAFSLTQPKHEEQQLAPSFEINKLNNNLGDITDESFNQSFRKSPEFQAFQKQFGANWDVVVDRINGRPTLVQGQGIPMIPGRGNSLMLSQVMVNNSAATSIDMNVLEGLARDFISKNSGLFRVNSKSLKLNKIRSGIFLAGDLQYVDFDFYRHGIPVEDAHVFFRINNGNLIQFGSEFVSSAKASKTPSVSKDEALTALLAHFGKSNGDIDRLTKAGTLSYIAEQASGDYSYRLVWNFELRFRGQAANWRTAVDAKSGEVVRAFDSNRYATVDGGIFPRTVTDAEVVRPFSDLLVVNGGNKVTDANGNYTFTTGSATSGLNGSFFNTNCQGCSSPTQPTATGDASGNIHFGTGGTNQTGNGTSTKADRNAFYHLNVARNLAKKWLNLSWFNTNVGVNVNINLTCNAFWDGTGVNFYRSGGGCNNTGEISDVMQHEWGHGMDDNDGHPISSNSGSMSEAVGDINGLHNTHDRCVGPGFLQSGGGETATCPTAVRDLAFGPVTAANVASMCPADTGGEFGREVHCESHILSGSAYDLSQSLVAALGTTNGWNTSEKLFFLTLLQAQHMRPTNSAPWYSAVLAVDDDNGNLADGTPNGCRIYAAFNSHGIASGSPVSCSTGGPPPPDQATYDPTLKAPKCGTAGASCDTGSSLVLGRAALGPEPNQPNTINSTCADGTSGTFHSDESNDRLKVTSVDGTNFAAGKSVRIDATVWAWTTPSADHLDLYFAADATAPSWTFIATVNPATAGSQTLSATYTLPSGGTLQAVRAVFRYQGAAASCGTNSGYDDHDDLIFTVGAGTPDTTPPTTTLTAPANGATLSGTVTVSANASDNVGVSRVEFYAGTTLIGTDTTSPYSISWNTTTVANGAYSLTSKAFDAANNSGTSPAVNVTVNNSAAPPDLTAVFDATLQAPKCGSGGKSCDTGATIINGRGTMTGGNEPNRPNTINDSCVDGNSGTYHSDESIDRMKVATNDGTAFAAGKASTITFTVFCFSTADRIDVYFTANAATPTWTLIGTQQCTGAGIKTFTAGYTLPTGATQAVRGNFRFNGSASSCTSGSFNDHDDLVFGVN